MELLKKCVVICIVCLTIYTSNAQETTKIKESKLALDIGIDFASRYVWRGLQFSDSPALQPYVEVTSGKLTLGVWASYETGGQVVGQEFDIYATYKINSFTIGFTDYSFPVDLNSDGYFTMKNHIGEAIVSFSGIDKFPISFMLGVNVYNDEDNSIYSEIGVPFKIGNYKLNAFLGAGNNMYTTDSEFTVTNVGFSASKDLKITDTFSLGLTASTIFNPDTDDAYLVFVFSL